MHMDRRPDRPLVVKCTFDRWNKRITFSSARNCSYDLLRHKVEQCFSLYATSYAITYKDDDGEVTDITTDSDLAEAIQYFQAGADDPPLSSAASILSGRSFGSRKITVRVVITVDYDGPSLSDTSSLASLEDYKNRNGSQQSFSFGTPSVDLDDDSITISSKDAISHAEHPASDDKSQSSTLSWDLLSQPSNAQAGPSTTLRFCSNATDPFDDEARMPATEMLSDPSAVFERMKVEEYLRDDSSSVHYETLRDNERGAAWLRDQNARTIRSRLGALPEPSISSGVTSIPEEEEEELGGALALEQDTRGKYYYSYTSSSSASQNRDSGYYAESVQLDDFQRAKPRPSSRNLNWLAAQQVVSSQSSSKPSSSQESLLPVVQDHSPDTSYTSNEIPWEVLQFLPLNPPPQETLTDCSECGVLLDSIRYVCSVCGEKKPASQSIKGKAKSIHAHHELGHSGLHPDQQSLGFHDYHHDNEYSYPPRPHYFASSSSGSGSTDSLISSVRHFKPLPRLPGQSGPPLSVSSSQATLVPPGQCLEERGYELCSGCLEHAGVTHAIEVGLPPGLSSPNISPSSSSSPEDAQRALEWRRLAPKKGQTRHAYHEKVWGHLGWEDVEQDDPQVSECSTCEAVTTHHRYKCASCKKFTLCRACYSQVHDLHPSHAFLVVPDQVVQSQSSSDSDLFESVPPDLGPEGEKSLVHAGVRCAHCLLDIVGARFHCAICDNVDICANCESAGLPGNLDSSDGGHTSSHVMIKIPYPLETDEVQLASRRAIHLWQGRDAASVGRQPFKPPKANSVVSSYARTVVGSGPRLPPDNDHHVYCNGCGNNIVGVRYQCANCPSSPLSVNLCAHCEEHSYTMHDPSHVFFKLPRPVQQPLASHHGFLPKLYKSPAGPPAGMDPRTFLSELRHSVAVCDRCMLPIPGVWFRCAYCAVDYCDACEAVDTHNDSHCFMVFKSAVDMQALKAHAPIENPPPVIPYPIYR
ncbi:hypothetical protein GGX14DRAFT_451130 [Mycena pura]|uniref:Uncharacterized protein n=1 Tax=Mycena pura TaxID=153505 RepID=A0AAD6VEG1_9AGAR|nr:hypothetical protein GGX14DRAFT_451130 [Mycena pura]